MPKAKKAKKSKANAKKAEIEMLDLADYRKKNPEKNLLGQEQLETLVSPEREIDLIIQRELSDLPENYSLLLVTSPENYYAVKSGILRYISGKKGIYITFNSPFSTISEDLKKYSVKSEGIFFFDLVSKMTNAKMPAEKQVYYFESATELTELMLLVEKKLSSYDNGSLIILDSVSTLLVYNDPKSVEKLVHVLVGKANSFNSSLIMLMVGSAEHEGTMQTIGQFCTKVARIDKLHI